MTQRPSMILSVHNDRRESVKSSILTFPHPTRIVSPV